MDARVDDVVSFWFGDRSAATYRRWFTRDDAFDAEIRARFGALQATAATGALESWRSTAHGALALVILYDQFPRNLFRADARAFATDLRALSVAQELVSSGRLAELDPLERTIALMPLMHSEDRAVQRDSVAQFAALATAHPDDAQLANAADYARKHAVIVERFGRFPHRNTTLGRASTAEELAFLQQPGSSF